LSDPRLGPGDLLGLEENLLGLIGRYDHHPVVLCNDHVTGVDCHAPDGYRDLGIKHLPATDPVQGGQVAIKHLEANLSQPGDIAQVAIQDHSDASPGFGSVGRELAEMADVALRRHRDHQIVRLQLLEHAQVGGDARHPLAPADRGIYAATKHGERNPGNALIGKEWS
jgi:hypothetical protein